MASIESLLNPVPDETHTPCCPLPSPALTAVTSRSSSHPKKQKLAKDAAIFTRDKIRGKLRYQPCEQRDDELTRIHREFQIYPMGNIADFPRHIPYNSDKKTFQEKTGRESFEVFQYTFKIPGVDKEWMIMWDYNIGLVRTTHLFKSQNYSKTTPAKMLDANPGLREICHSITGGAIVAQGYWMPFEVAKAVAATFCHGIRHALTPIFGLDFPSLCIPPHDRARFGQMIIDPSIVKQATETANIYRHLEYRHPPATTLPVQPPPATTTTFFTLGDEDDNDDPCHPPPPKPYRHVPLPRSSPYRHRHRHHVSYPGNSSSGTSQTCRMAPGTHATPHHPHQQKNLISHLLDTPESYCMSPRSPFQNGFTPVNTPRSSSSAMCSRTSSPQVIVPHSSRRCAYASSLSTRHKQENRLTIRGFCSDEDSETSSSTLYSSTSGTATDCLSELDDDEEYQASDDSDVETRSRKRLKQILMRAECVPIAIARDVAALSKAGTASAAVVGKRKGAGEQRADQRPSSTALFAREVKAAHALLSLHMQDATGSDEEGVGRQQNGRKRRRASA